jgi:hypothetical protein
VRPAYSAGIGYGDTKWSAFFSFRLPRLTRRRSRPSNRLTIDKLFTLSEMKVAAAGFSTHDVSPVEDGHIKSSDIRVSLVYISLQHLVQGYAIDSVGDSKYPAFSFPAGMFSNCPC